MQQAEDSASREARSDQHHDDAPQQEQEEAVLLDHDDVIRFLDVHLVCCSDITARIAAASPARAVRAVLFNPPSPAGPTQHPRPGPTTPPKTGSSATN